MTEKDFFELFNIKELRDTISESTEIKDFYVTNKKIVYSLRECLENADKKILNHIYTIYKYVLSKDKKLKNNPTYNEMIDILESEIPSSFSLFLISLEKQDRETLKYISKNKKTDKINKNLLSNGFMFGFKENNKNVYIIPNELLNIYNKFLLSDENKKQDLSTTNMYILAYIVMNGVLEIKYMKDLLINEYSLNVTENEIDDIIKKYYEIYKNKYFISTNLKNSFNDITDELIKKKKKIPSFKLDETELFYYLSMINNFTKELANILKKYPKGIEDIILFRCSLMYQPLDQIVDEFKFSKTERKKVLEILEKYENNFRYWIFNGRTIEEYDKIYFTEHYYLKSKPKSSDLKNCLNQIPKELLEFFKDYYEVSDVESLIISILDNSEDTVKRLGINEIEDIINSNNDKLTDNIPTEFLKCGFVILYKENNKIKYFIPKEILDIFKSEKNDNEQIYIDNLVAGYVNINGILKKEKLKELLKEYHNIDISIKQLDKIIENVEAKIIDNTFYTYIIDMNQEDIKKFIISKEFFNKYKEINFFNIDCEDEFKDLLRKLISEKLVLNFQTNDIYETIVFMAKTGTFSKDSLNFVFEDYDITLKKDLEKEIMNLYNKYKKYISIWLYNGYSITEFTEMNKSTKVGRNEPCPCGSGKKYKKCCGK